MKSGIRVAFVACLPALMVLCVLATWNPAGDFWIHVEPPKAQVEAYDSQRLILATVLDSSIYSPTKLARLIREPQNTVSNLAYVFVGIAVCVSARRVLSKSFGFAAIFLGLGSGLYHASLLPEWRMLDILGVYAVLFTLVACGFSAALRTRIGDIYVASATWVCAFAAGVHRNDYRIGGFKILDSKYVVVACVFVGCCLALVCTLRIGRVAQRTWLVSLLAGSSALAFFGGLSDRFGGLLADPDLLVQGHTLWHAFGAVALLTAYEIYARTGYDRSVFATSPWSNKSLQPTATAVTLPAGAGSAPSVAVAEH